MLHRLFRTTFLMLTLLSALLLLSALAGRAVYTTIAVYDEPADLAHDLRLHDMNRALTVPMTRTKTDERSPAWSPDGLRLAYLRVDQGTQALVIRDLGGRESAVMDVSASGDPETAALAWSPTGEQIAFTALVGDRQAIFLLNLRTGERRQLTATGSSASSPAWSPDGASLAFAWSLVANQDIFIADVARAVQPLARETEVQRITSDFGMDAMPAWSPRGGRIAFISTRDGNSNIYVYDLAAGTTRRVTFNAVRNIAPAWLPDGSALTYRSLVDGIWGLYRVDASCLDGGQCRPVRILDGDIDISWRP